MTHDMATSTVQAARNRQSSDITVNHEEFRLIWLDARIDDSPDSLHTQTLLLQLNPAVQFYTDVTLCVNLVRSLKDEQILLVVSGSYAQQTLVQLYGLSSLRAVFVFCHDRQRYRVLINQHEKIVDIFTTQKELLDSILKTMGAVKRQTLIFRKFDQEQKSVYTTEFFTPDHLVHLHFLRESAIGEDSNKEMIELCSDYYRHSKTELKKIEQFKTTYKKEKAIWWYTTDSFLYKLLNKALRTDDYSLIYPFRYFINDLCAQLENEHKKSKSDQVLTLYRGQRIPYAEVEEIKKCVGKVIASYGFFSTSSLIDAAHMYAGESVTNKDPTTSVLFKISADPSLQSTIFADIDELSQFSGQEKEVLFSIGARFIIDSVHFDSERNLWTVQMTSTDEGSKKLVETIREWNEDLVDCPQILRYCTFLVQSSHWGMDHGRRLLTNLLKTVSPNHPDLPAVYRTLGETYLCHDKGRDLVLKYFQKSYALCQESMPPNTCELAAILRQLAQFYSYVEGNLGYDYFQQWFATLKLIYSNDHIQKASAMESIGDFCSRKKSFEAAISWYTDAVEMYSRLGLAYHTKIAHCLWQLGDIYEELENFDLALEYFQRSIDVKKGRWEDPQKSFIVHSNDFDRIPTVCVKKEELIKGLSICKKETTDMKRMLSRTHPYAFSGIIDIEKSKNNSNEARETYLEALDALMQVASLNAVADQYLSTVECPTGISDIHYRRKTDC